MIQRKPANRLGANGPEEVKEHPWFRDYAWDKLINKEKISPFIPNVSINENIISRMKIIMFRKIAVRIVMKICRKRTRYS